MVDYVSDGFRSDPLARAVRGHGVTSKRLAKHVESRERWLAAAVERLQSDERLVGGYLYGSLGRGDADEWSDIDLAVIVRDRDLSSIVANRLAFGEPFGDAVFILDSTWNAPIDGAQLNVLYLLDSGLPVYVDFNMFPAAMGELPSDTRLLFERPQTPLPRTP
jgi:predicted nucleotidyltransferase